MGRIGYLTLVLAVIGGGTYIYKEHIEDNIFPKRWGVVEEGKIYRSGQLSARLVGPMLEKHNIQVVINLNKGTSGKDPQAESEAIKTLGIEQLQLSLGGNGTGDINSYIEALTKLHQAVEAGKPTLVHCAAGAQRTGGVIAFYRLLFQNKSSNEVLIELEQYGWRPRKNQILVEYLNRHMEAVAAALVARGVLPTRPRQLPRLSLPLAITWPGVGLCWV